MRSAVAHPLKARAYLAHPPGEHSLVHFKLGLARTPLRPRDDAPAGPAAARTTDPGLPIEVGPAADQAGLGVGELRELYLQVALVGTGPVREDVQDEFRSGHDPALETLFEIALLGRRQLVVEGDQRGARGRDDGPQFLQFSGADEPPRMRFVPGCRHLVGADEISRQHKLTEFVQVRIPVVRPGGRPLRASLGKTHGNQHGIIARYGSLKQHLWAPAVFRLYCC